MWDVASNLLKATQNVVYNSEENLNLVICSKSQSGFLFKMIEHAGFCFFSSFV